MSNIFQPNSKEIRISRENADKTNTMNAFAGTLKAWKLQSLLKIWSIVIADYTRCELTFAEDRWNAIAGIATLMSERTCQELVHGLWVSAPPLELLWSSCGRKFKLEDGFLTKTLIYLAPTWSWISVPWPIDTFDWMDLVSSSEDEDEINEPEAEALPRHKTFSLPFINSTAHHQIALARVIPVLALLTPSGHPEGCAVLSPLPMVKIGDADAMNRWRYSYSCTVEYSIICCQTTEMRKTIICTFFPSL